MLRRLLPPRAKAAISRCGCQRYFSTPSASHRPLRLLFCGADEFSIYSLKALHALQNQKPDTLASIDVVCRPDKRVGRGLKQIQEVPIKNIAQHFHLPLHQIDTFTGWSPPSPIDLIIAVSFGLLIPARILEAAKYGGLNVHPSLLPDLRGPAPIQHTLLKRRSHTGVTLQTMHPTRFDHGAILAQTPAPGIPVPEDGTPDALIRTLGPFGAELLRKGIEDGIFVSPKPIVEVTGSEGFAHAPKITPNDRKIDWETWSATDIIRRDRVLDKLWDVETYGKFHGPEHSSKRITYQGPWREVARKEIHEGRLLSTGQSSDLQLWLIGTRRKPQIAFELSSRGAVSPTAATIEGGKTDMALPSLINAASKRLKARDASD